MEWNVYVTRLQAVFAQLFPHRDDCVALCHEAGVDVSRIDFDEPSYVRWFHICDESLKQETFGGLVSVAVSKYPQNRGLIRAVGDWSANQGLPSVLPVRLADVFQASIVRDLAGIDKRLAVMESAMQALAAGREAEIAAGTVGLALAGDSDG